ncbi:MAG: hypothetical protein L0387_34605 [Acidobacteria bacterium]|nr:hypothetical protein [Acidobacteriota bacterium]
MRMTAAQLPPVRVVNPPLSLLRATRGELAATLPSRERTVLDLLGVSDFLACITVAGGERAAGRMILPQEKVDRAVVLIRGLGICCRRSRFDVVLRAGPLTDTDHQASFVPRGNPGATRGMIYLGLTEEFVDGVEAAEMAREGSLLARLFGYPDCCSRFFIDYTGRQFDKTPASIPNTGPFPRDMNPLIPCLYGVSLLFHFPCSPRCEPSLCMLCRRRRYLARLAPSSRALGELGTGIALYGPEVGIALVTAYRHIDCDTYLMEEVTARSVTSRDVFSRMPAGTLIRLRSPHTFEIGGMGFDSQHSFAALFT